MQWLRVLILRDSEEKLIVQNVINGATRIYDEFAVGIKR